LKNRAPGVGGEHQFRNLYLQCRHLAISKKPMLDPNGR
jgi:hypothetical protein